MDMYAFGKGRRVCPACGLVAFRDPKVAAAVLIEDAARRVLLVQRKWNPMQGYWSLPAGFVDYDESPEAAARRECREETGLELKALQLLDIVYGREHEQGADIVIIYRGQAASGILAASDDASGAAFFALDALPPLAFQATRAALAHLQSPGAEHHA